MSPRSQLKWRRRGHHSIADIGAHEVTPRINSLVHGITPCTTNTTGYMVPDEWQHVDRESVKMSGSIIAYMQTARLQYALRLAMKYVMSITPRAEVVDVDTDVWDTDVRM